MNLKAFSHPEILKTHSLSQPLLVDTTQFGDIWQVVRKDGSKAALKIYGPRGMASEAGGFAFLRSRGRLCCADIYFSDDKIAILEWLDGSHLGDMAREGNLVQADRDLVALAGRIH